VVNLLSTLGGQEEAETGLGTNNGGGGCGQFVGLALGKLSLLLITSIGLFSSQLACQGTHTFALEVSSALL
jgi:hypothetical protein